MENDQNNVSEFDNFAASGDIEVGYGNQPPPAESNKAPDKEIVDQEDKNIENTEDDQSDSSEDDQSDSSEDDQSDSSEDDQSDEEKPRDSKKHHVERLKRERAVAQKEVRELRQQLESLRNNDLSARLENIEKSLQGGNYDANTDSGYEISEPDASDIGKYPLGHLDDRYVEDRLDWLAEIKAAKQAEAVLQRQQENERNAAIQLEQQQLLEKVDGLVTRGSDIYEDFQENVVEPGMRGDWDLSQTTFEAAHKAENGVQILYDLAHDKKEATRVAQLSPYEQVVYVYERNNEIKEGKRLKKVPRAGEPPKNTARGANSRMQINPATDNLDDFEKAWELDQKR